jgi:hypothetical protein
MKLCIEVVCISCDIPKTESCKILNFPRQRKLVGIEGVVRDRALGALLVHAAD